MQRNDCPSRDLRNPPQADALIDACLELGAYRAGVISADRIETDRSFRDMCAANACGRYGKCHMCPPDVGEIEGLMSQIKQYDYALVYQTVSALEDSYDFEGMVAARLRTYPIGQGLRSVFAEAGISRVLHLGAGGCGVCKACAKETGEPCRFPELAMPSLEAYGINVSQLAKAADMDVVLYHV